MTKWICHNCGHKNDIDDKRCKGTVPKNAYIGGGGKCFKKRQQLDKVIGENKDD